MKAILTTSLLLCSIWSLQACDSGSKSKDTNKDTPTNTSGQTSEDDPETDDPKPSYPTTYLTLDSKANTESEDSENKTNNIDKPFIFIWDTHPTSESIDYDDFINDTPYLEEFYLSDDQLELTIMHNPNYTQIDNGYNYNINWGDGSIDNNVTGTITHKYEERNTYTVSITGDYPSIKIQCDDFTTSFASTNKLTKIKQWGNNHWLSMENLFTNCTQLEFDSQDKPNLESVESMASMFINATHFNEDITNWDVSNVKNMSKMFKGTKYFNQDIGVWDVSNVSDMSHMFESAVNFNKELNSWNVSNVENFSNMFNSAMTFNQPLDNWNTGHAKNTTAMFKNTAVFDQEIGMWDISNVLIMDEMFNQSVRFNKYINNWDTSSVTSMKGVFNGAIKFNQTLEQWDVSNVKDMSFMFYHAENYNHCVDNWNVSNVSNMYLLFSHAYKFNQPLNQWNIENANLLTGMFYNATDFDQPLDQWDISNTPILIDLLKGVTLSTKNYDALLNSWGNQLVNQGHWFHAGNSQYTPNSTASQARNTLIEIYEWDIQDAGPAIISN